MKQLDNNNDEDVRVSVCCLAYNHEKYIRHTLDGFVNQRTDFKFEILIHDDASTDHTPDIIKPIFQEENQYSKGIKIIAKYIYPKVRGCYIALCEGDDYWNDPYKLQKQFDVMETHPECSLSTHKVLCCNEDGTSNEKVIPDKCYRIQGSRIIEEKELAKCYWIRGWYPFHTSSYFYRKEVIDVDLEYSNDVGMMRKCLTKGSVFYIDEPMSTRRLWAIGSWTSRMQNTGINGWHKKILLENEAEDRFDQYTNYKFHDYIQIRRFDRLMLFMQYPEFRSEAMELIRKYDLSMWKLRKKLSVYRFLKLQMKYILVMYFPDFYPQIRKCWRRMNGYSKDL